MNAHRRNARGRIIFHRFQSEYVSPEEPRIGSSRLALELSVFAPLKSPISITPALAITHLECLESIG